MLFSLYIYYIHIYYVYILFTYVNKHLYICIYIYVHFIIYKADKLMTLKMTLGNGRIQQHIE